jgi:hypothetical protein
MRKVRSQKRWHRGCYSGPVPRSGTGALRNVYVARLRLCKLVMSWPLTSPSRSVLDRAGAPAKYFSKEHD